MTRGGRDGIGRGKGRRQGKAYEEKDGKNRRTRKRKSAWKGKACEEKDRKNRRTRKRKRKSAWTRESGSRMTRKDIVEEMGGGNG